MDKISEQLVNFTRDFSTSDLSTAAVVQATALVVDSMACIVAGAGAEAAPMMARIARRVQANPGATVFGFGFQTSPELAASRSIPTRPSASPTRRYAR